MKKPSICIPHPAEFWFVVIFLGCGACAFLILALICALRCDLLNVILCFVAVALFIAGVRFEVRMNGDFYRIDEDAIHIYRDWRESGSLRWDELTSLALRRGQYRGKPGRFLEAGVQVIKDGRCVEDRRVSIPMPDLPARNAFLWRCMTSAPLAPQCKNADDPRDLER